MKHYILIITILLSKFCLSQTQFNYTPNGILKTANLFSSTLQTVTDKNGNKSPLKISTSKIALGVSTGTALLNFPDTAVTPSSGIQFGSNIYLYRAQSNQLSVGGNNVFNCSNFQSANYNAPILFLGCTALNFTPNTLTGSLATPSINLTQTWNTTGNPTAIFANITNTASGSTSNLIDLQVGSTSKFKVDKNGGISCMGMSTFNSNIGIGGLVDAIGGTDMRLVNANATKSVVISQDYSFNSSPSTLFEVKSTTKGSSPAPRMTTTQRNAIPSPLEGLEVYDLTLHKKFIWDGTVWQPLW